MAIYKCVDFLKLIVFLHTAHFGSISVSGSKTVLQESHWSPLVSFPHFGHFPNTNRSARKLLQFSQ